MSVVQDKAGEARAVASTLGLVGASLAHQLLIDRINRVAPTDVEILIQGPSGVGKELYAHCAHLCSHRRAGVFVPINCGAIPEALFENEMFGHAAGAYTGADRNGDGLIDQAEQGTLFLDEVDALPIGNQVKLLRFLQQREYRRLGEPHVRRADVRVIAASNADLPTLVRERKFREDLFYRLRVVPLAVPPLRDRPEDVAVLLGTFVARFAEYYRLPAVRFSPDAWDKLLQYPWPGNVRELENLVRSLTCQQLNRLAIAEDLALLVPRLGGAGPVTVAAECSSETDYPFQEAKDRAVEEFERSYLCRALHRADGNIARAARNSCKHRRAFFELLKKHKIAAENYRAQDMSDDSSGNRDD